MLKNKVILLCVLLIGTFAVSITGCKIAKSYSDSEASASMKFTDYKEEMGKEITLSKVTEQMIFDYSDFSLQEGEIVFQIVSKDDEVIFEERLDHSDREQGTINVKDLEASEEYTLKLFGDNAVKGSIELEW